MATVPEVIYTIPPSSPLYPCTYVRVYASTPETVTFGYTAVVAENYCTYGVALQVQCHPVNAAFKFNHLAVHNVGQTVNTNNTVSYGNDSTFVLSFCRKFKTLNTLLDNFTDFRRIQLLHALFLDPNLGF